MSQSDSYFSLECQPGQESSQPPRRPNHPPAASYLQQLELPSLPPLSQLLTEPTEHRTKNASNPMTCSTKQQKQKQKQQQQQQQQQQRQAVATAVMMQAQPYATHPMYFSEYVPATVAMNTLAKAPTEPDLFVPTPSIGLMDGFAAPLSLDPPMFPLSASSPVADHVTMINTTTDSNDTNPNTTPSVVTNYQYNNNNNNNNNHHQHVRQPSESSTSSDKVYSFVAIPGTNQKKRPRRRYDEIERLYHCNWPACTKSYGTLNHLNAHVSMQKHGNKRHPTEFKEMRKEWRRQKKEREANRKASEEAIKQQQVQQVQQVQQQQQQHHHQNQSRHHQHSLLQTTPYPFQSTYTVPPSMAMTSFY